MKLAYNTSHIYFINANYCHHTIQTHQKKILHQCATNAHWGRRMLCDEQAQKTLPEIMPPKQNITQWKSGRVTFPYRCVFHQGRVWLLGIRYFVLLWKFLCFVCEFSCGKTSFFVCINEMQLTHIYGLSHGSLFSQSDFYICFCISPSKNLFLWLEVSFFPHVTPSKGTTSTTARPLFRRWRATQG